MYKIRPLHAIDGYKPSHYFMMPKGTNLIYNNLTARSDKHAKKLYDFYDNKVVFIGLQGVIKAINNNWQENFFNKSKEEVVKEFKRRVENMTDYKYDVSHIESLHDLGYLPIEIKALEEGTVVPIKVPMFTMHSTNKDFAWVITYLEDTFSSSIYKSINNATMAFMIRKIVESYVDDTCENKNMLLFMVHDFSLRGMSTLPDGMVSCFPHLSSFVGTDNYLAVDYAEDYYNANVEKQLVAKTVPAASEHSVMCMGTKEGELDTYKRILNTFPTGICAIVSDTWNYYNVLTNYTRDPELNSMILNRDGKVVFRPDSGTPIDIICGTAIPVNDLSKDIGHYININESSEPKVFIHNDKYYKGWQNGLNIIYEEIEPTNEMKGSLRILYEVFGGTVNNKGYKQINPKVGLIYGDAMTPKSIAAILSKMKEIGFAADNMIFGIGSFSYNLSSRDTYGMAFKATYGEINGEGINIFKDPITDDGTKKSACGKIRVVRNEEGELICLDKQDTWEDSLLETVFKDGKFIKETSLSNIRKVLWNWDDSM